MEALQQLLDTGVVWHNSDFDTSGNSDSGKHSLTQLSTGNQLAAKNIKKLSRQKAAQNHSVTKFGIDTIDKRLPSGGLPFGHVHEWALETNLVKGQRRNKYKKGEWLAPLFLLSGLVRSALTHNPPVTENNKGQKHLLVWIGKKCWPTPQLLERVLGKETEQDNWDWQTHSIFLNPPCRETRIWSISETLKNPAVLAVIADGSNFDTAMMRRAQLAAQRGGSLGLIVRPPWEQEVPSTAYSRWSVTTAKTDSTTPSWQLTLRKIRGTLQTPTFESLNDASKPQMLPMSWDIEWNEELRNGKGALSSVQTTSSEISRETSISSAA